MRRRIGDRHRILRTLDRDVAADKDTLDRNILPRPRVVAVDLRGDVLGCGVSYRTPGRNYLHLVALDNGQRLRIAALRSEDRNLVADRPGLRAHDIDASRVGGIADHKAVGAERYDQCGRNRHDRLVSQFGHLPRSVLLHVAVLVTVLRDDHLGTAGKRAALENEGRLAGIVLGAATHVVRDRNRHVGRARAALRGRDRHPLGNLRHPVRIGIYGDYLLRSVLRFEGQRRGTRQNRFRKPVPVLLVAAPEAAQGHRSEDRSRYLFNQFHNRLFFLLCTS